MFCAGTLELAGDIAQLHSFPQSKHKLLAIGQRALHGDVQCIRDDWQRGEKSPAR
jgi:hypothetical protein